MNLENLKDFGKDLLENKSINNIVNSFIKELSNYLEHKNNSTITNYTLDFEEGELGVITSINKEKITLLNPNKTQEKEAYIAISDEEKEKLNDQGISNVYKMDKNSFYNLNVCDKLIMRNGQFELYDGEIDIKDDKSWFIIKDLESSLEVNNNNDFIIDKEQDDRFLINRLDGKGYNYIYKDLYPEFQVGDIITRVDGKYYKKEE